MMMKCLEVTPKHLRLRKKHLDPHERKRMAKKYLSKCLISLRFLN